MFYFSQFNNFSKNFNENLKILDLTPKHANLETIKKAYHLKAKKYHPDKGGSNDDFITIHKAYDFLMNNSIFLLKNDNQKNINNNEINNINYNEKKTNNNNNNNNNNDIKNKKLKTKNITYPIEITLKEAFYGKKKLIKLKRNRICPKCKDLTNNNNNNNICSECNNKKYTNQTKEIELKLRPGIFNGCKIILKGESEEYLDFIPGDVIFEIKIKEEKNIKREGSDLFINYSIPLFISLCGGIINIKLFDNNNFKVNVNSIIHPGMKKTLIGKGMPFYDNNKIFGNLHIKFNVDFPKKLEEWQKNLILNAFNNNNNNLKNNFNFNNNNNNKNKEGKNKKKIQFNLNEKSIQNNNNINLNKDILYLKDFKEENLNKSYFYNKK